MTDTEIALPSRPLANPERYVLVPVGKGKSEIIAVTLAAALRRSLDYDLQDAWSEIGLGPYAMQTDFIGFRQYLYGHVIGGEGRDLNEYMMDVKERYGKWREAMQDQTMTLNICLDVCHNEASLRSVDRRLQRRKGTAQRCLIAGLKEYSRVNKMWLKYKR